MPDQKQNPAPVILMDEATVQQLPFTGIGRQYRVVLLETGEARIITDPKTVVLDESAPETLGKMIALAVRALKYSTADK